MRFEFTNNKLGSIFGMTTDLMRDERNFSVRTGILKILWNRNDKPVSLAIDNVAVIIQPGQLVTTTFFQHVKIERSSPALCAFIFNREFYCIADHDKEVSCNGILFFGTQALPLITIPADQVSKFESLFHVFMDEFNTPDQIQGEMLQMLLKRLIIICTRLAKDQLAMKNVEVSRIDTIRQFNFLVDVHFKTKRQVNDYALMLNRSPKTLSNLFLIYNQKTPQQIIHERIMLEAKRLLHFSEKNNKEIAYELGFEAPDHFSKFFKKMVGLTPGEFKKNNIAEVGGNIYV